MSVSITDIIEISLDGRLGISLSLTDIINISVDDRLVVCLFFIEIEISFVQLCRATIVCKVEVVRIPHDMCYSSLRPVGFYGVVNHTYYSSPRPVCFYGVVNHMYYSSPRPLGFMMS